MGIHDHEERKRAYTRLAEGLSVAPRKGILVTGNEWR